MKGDVFHCGEESVHGQSVFKVDYFFQHNSCLLDTATGITGRHTGITNTACRYYIKTFPGMQGTEKRSKRIQQIRNQERANMEIKIRKKSCKIHL
jgi:hypothetical protein